MIFFLGLSVAGLAVLVLGAELLTRGGAGIARRLGIAPIVVGLTVVSLGTSAPELAIGIDAALMGNGALAVANIAGTNTVNVLLILGLSALIRPLALHMATIRVDLPAMLAAALLLLVLAADGVLSRLDGTLLLAAGLVYTVLIVRSSRREGAEVRDEYAEEYGRPGTQEQHAWAMALSAIQLAAGIVLVVVAADWFVVGAVGMAGIWGVSDDVIGLTVVAIGTSAPELVTMMLSTLKGDRDIAIGNLLGSSVFNICFILGLTCMVPAAGLPVPPGVAWMDIPVMALVALVCVPVFLSGREVSRIEGGAFVASYGAYIGVLLATRV